jgi:hypothetical protein
LRYPTFAPVAFLLGRPCGPCFVVLNSLLRASKFAVIRVRPYRDDCAKALSHRIIRSLGPIIFPKKSLQNSLFQPITGAETGLHLTASTTQSTETRRGRPACGKALSAALSRSVRAALASLRIRSRLLGRFLGRLSPPAKIPFPAAAWEVGSGKICEVRRDNSDWLRYSGETKCFVIDMAAIHTGNVVSAGAYFWNGDSQM